MVLFVKKSKLISILVAASLSSAFGSVLPEKMIAGYLDITATSSASKVVLSNAKADGYNLLIVAFASVNGTQVSVDQQYVPMFTAKLAEAKKAGIPALVSFGGQLNTFKPGELSEEQIKVLAKNTVAFVSHYGFAGIDFDLEVPTDPTMLDQLIQSIKAGAKTQGRELAVTAAPQLNSGLIVTTGSREDYSQAIANGDFDALFFQEYNTGPENQASFISSSFADLKTRAPDNTKLVVGQPAAAVGAGSATLYHPSSSNTLSTEEVTALMLPELAMIQSDPQWGGVMAWSLNVDYDAADYGDANHTSGSFAYGLKDCVLNGACDTPPEPKPPAPNNTIEISNFGSKFGITVEVMSHGEKVFVSDYLNPKADKVYSKSSNPSVSSLEASDDLTVVWKTYTNVPIYCGSFSLTANQHIMINSDTQVCEIKSMD